MVPLAAGYGRGRDSDHAGARPGLLRLCPHPGLFEPLVELGEEVTAGAPAAIIHPHDTPWREPAIAAFGRGGTVICKRVPGRNIYLLVICQGRVSALGSSSVAW